MMARFPLEARGASDSDPVVRQDQTQFKATMSRILAQDSGTRPEPDTVRQFIERTNTVNASNVEPDGGAARVGDFVFERVDGSWWLVRVPATGNVAQ